MKMYNKYLHYKRTLYEIRSKLKECSENWWEGINCSKDPNLPNFTLLSFCKNIVNSAVIGCI